MRCMPALCGNTRRGALKDGLCEPAGPSDYAVPAARAERSLLREAGRPPPAAGKPL